MSFNKCIKNELGKLSKQLVEKINSDIIEKLQLNQWRNTNAVLKLFNNITDKSNCSFIQFDIKEFYPSITVVNECSTPSIQICETTYKHQQEQPLHYELLMQVVTFF